VDDPASLEIHHEIVEFQQIQLFAPFLIIFFFPLDSLVLEYIDELKGTKILK